MKITVSNIDEVVILKKRQIFISEKEVDKFSARAAEVKRMLAKQTAALRPQSSGALPSVLTTRHGTNERSMGPSTCPGQHNRSVGPENSFVRSVSESQVHYD